MHYLRIKEQIAQWEAQRGRRLPLNQLAQRTGISPAVLSRMSHPEGYVTNTRYLEALCRFFGVGPEELIRFKPDIDPDGMEQIDLEALDATTLTDEQ